MYLNLFYVYWIILNFNWKHILSDELQQQEGSILFSVILW